MSHILDALRRAEDERKLGKPPDRGMISGPLRNSTAPRRHRRWGITAVALIVAAGMLYAFYQQFPADVAEDKDDARTHAPDVRRQATADPTSSTEAAPPQPEPPRSSPVTQPAAPPQATAESTSRAQRPVQVQMQREDRHIAQPALPKARLDDAQGIDDMDALFEAQAPATTASARTSPAPTVLQPRDALAGSPDDANTAAPARGTENADDVAASDARADASTDDSRPDLPDARSAGVPGFTIQVHAWAPQPEERFLRTAGRRFGEGDDLPNGARIERITRNGVVLQWRGQRVLRSLGR